MEDHSFQFEIIEKVKEYNMAFNYDEYLRTDEMPTLWCVGDVGDELYLKALIRAIDKLGLEYGRCLVVSGIGCSEDLALYINVVQFILHMEEH